MSFLQLLGDGFTAQPNETKVSTRAKIERNPTDANLRVFKSGAIFPSAALVVDFSLHYHMRDSEIKGNGFDIIDSRELQNTKGASTPFLMITPVGKKEGKVDLFSQTMYNEDGTPVADVMTQGSTSFGDEMLRMLSEVYGITLTETSDYCDLVLQKVDVISTQLQNATNGIYYVPKTVSRGPLKGTIQYTRRENLDIYVLVPKDLINNNAAIVTKKVEVKDTIVSETATVETN